jgi:hypothetical protein
VLIAGGVGPGFVLQTSAVLYDPCTGTFTATGPMIARGEVLRCGGAGERKGSGRGWRHDLTNLAAAEIYDPATGRFTATGSMRAWRYLHTITPLPDGIGAGGGSGPITTFPADRGALDPATGTSRSRDR